MFGLSARNRANMTIFANKRFITSAKDIRSTFLQYFVKEHGHKVVKSSSVVPLCDPTVPFVNAGMNQFKGIFLGRCNPPHPRVVNSQKCIRVGGKHNDLDIVGTDGTHHTFFEMLGNWSFGDYYKAEACKMAWELVTGPYQIKPENLVVTYFAGEKALGLNEDKECREVWRGLGLQENQIRPLGLQDNFWEMGLTGPCGPCTEIHYVNPDGSLTEIWNIVFIQYMRESDGTIKQLPKRHVDTGMGLERMAALLQNVQSNYDTDLFMPIINAIEKKSKSVPRYGGKFGESSTVDCAYRCLADHARMISVCLADRMYPVRSLKLKQIMRKSFKISHDIFNCKTGLLSHLYDHVSLTLEQTYPELILNEKDAKTIIDHEEQSYWKMRTDLGKQWADFSKQYPEAEHLSDLELPWFFIGYDHLKQAMSKANNTLIPSEVVLKLYEAYGFKEDVIERIADVNNYTVDWKQFDKILRDYKLERKARIKAQKVVNFDRIIDKLNQNGCHVTNDNCKYNYRKENNQIIFPPLESEIIAILNESFDWMDVLDINSKDGFYLVTKDTNFYCENGGQKQDGGTIQISNDIRFEVTSVFKIKDIVFHEGAFVNLNKIKENILLKLGDKVVLKVDEDKRLSTMRNHTAMHLFNAAVKKVLCNSVMCQIESSITDKDLVLNLGVFGEKLSQKHLAEVQNLIRDVISSNSEVQTSVMDVMELTRVSDVVTVPGEIYPETGLRLVQIQNEHITSREICSGTHVPSTGDIGSFCISYLKGAGSNAPIVRALTGDAANQVIELTERARRLQQRAMDLNVRDVKDEITFIRQSLAALEGGDPHCLEILETLEKQTTTRIKTDLKVAAQNEIRCQVVEAEKLGCPFIVHLLKGSQTDFPVQDLLESALTACVDTPAMVFGFDKGLIKAVCQVPNSFITEEFTAERWMSCILPILDSVLASNKKGINIQHYASMKKVSKKKYESLVPEAMKLAASFANKHTHKQTQDKQTRQA